MSRKKVLVALSVLMGLGLFVPHSAWAQRDAAAKIRGDYRSFWDQSYPKWGSGSATRRSGRSQVVYRSYATAPAPAAVVVAQPAAQPEVATAPPAQPSPESVAATTNSSDARRFSYDPAAPAAAVASPAPAMTVAAPTYVAPRPRASRNVQRHLDPWQYPKSDARHWRPF